MHRWSRYGLPFLAFMTLTLSACQVMDPVIRRTSTPVPDRPPQPRVYTTPVNLFDDFSDPASGWEIGEYSVGSVGYREGEYFVRVEDEDVFTRGQRFEWYGDVTIEVTARQASGPESNDTGYGVMCRVNYDPDIGELEGYAFLAAGDGYYAIARYVGGDSQLLVGWEKSDTVRQGSGSNDLEAICASERLIFYVNGVRLAETRDESFSSGDVALIGTTYDSGAAEFRFDNFSLSSP
jgi:hypothetical protein